MNSASWVFQVMLDLQNFCTLNGLKISSDAIQMAAKVTEQELADLSSTSGHEIGTSAIRTHDRVSNRT